MCDITWLPKLLVWSFLGGSLVAALVSRKLNEHLLAPPPPPPTGPFAFLLRRKYHVRPNHFLSPAQYFDEEGQKWARLFVRLIALCIGLFLATMYFMSACGKTP